MGDLFRYRNDPHRLINFQVVGVFLVCAFFQVGGWPARGGMSGFPSFQLRVGRRCRSFALVFSFPLFFIDIDVLALLCAVAAQACSHDAFVSEHSRNKNNQDGARLRKPAALCDCS